MAINTDNALRRSVIYEVYVRSHTPEGTFKAIEPDLDRIAALGVDIVWFMPIHPIGELNKKGSLGCPYANRDYRTVNPEYGTLEDFLHLVEEIHKRGMKCIIDVVYNHTSPDSTLVAEHPDYFYYKPDGCRGNKVGDWTDVVDLNYENRALWQYQIDSLCYWAQYVDGFRAGGLWAGSPPGCGADTAGGHLAGRKRTPGAHSGLPGDGLLCRDRYGIVHSFRYPVPLRPVAAV